LPPTDDRGAIVDYEWAPIRAKLSARPARTDSSHHAPRDEPGLVSRARRLLSLWTRKVGGLWRITLRTRLPRKHLRTHSKGRQNVAVWVASGTLRAGVRNPVDAGRDSFPNLSDC